MRHRFFLAALFLVLAVPNESSARFILCTTNTITGVRRCVGVEKCPVTTLPPHYVNLHCFDPAVREPQKLYLIGPMPTCPGGGTESDDDSTRTGVAIANVGTVPTPDLRLFYVQRDTFGQLQLVQELFNLTAAAQQHEVLFDMEFLDHSQAFGIIAGIPGTPSAQPDSVQLKIVRRDLATHAFVSVQVLTFSLSEPPSVGVTPVEMEKSIRLSVFPNPTAGGLRVDFTQPVAGPISIDVYNVAGQRVKRLHDGMTGAGTHTFTWSGVTSNGTTVPPGVYFVRLSTRDFRGADRMVVVR